jgi:hypothetical protein
MLSVTNKTIMLNDVMLSVIMLYVVAHFHNVFIIHATDHTK